MKEMDKEFRNEEIDAEKTLGMETDSGIKWKEWKQGINIHKIF